MLQVFGSRVRVDAVSKVADMEMAEKEKMKAKVDRILKHDMNVFINRYLTFSFSHNNNNNMLNLHSQRLPCRQLIYNYPEQLFADAGIMAIEHADFEGVERLALVTGSQLVTQEKASKIYCVSHENCSQKATIWLHHVVTFLSLA